MSQASILGCIPPSVVKRLHLLVFFHCLPNGIVGFHILFLEGFVGKRINLLLIQPRFDSFLIVGVSYNRGEEGD